MSEKVILKDIRTSDFQHPEDKKALDLLDKIPLLNSTLETILKNTSEAMMKFIKAGSCVEISENQYASVYKIFLHCCEILEIKKIPKLYLEGKRGITADVDGITEPIVLISEGAVEVLSEDELYFLFGQALGHIKGGHELYHKVSELLLTGFSEISNLATISIQEGLLHWYRASILSADRIGLLCCQSIETAISVLAKQSGFIRHYSEPLNIDEFKNQAKEFKVSQQKMMNKFWEGIQYLSKNSKSPLTILRAAELMEWAESENYGRIITSNKSSILLSQNPHLSIEIK